MSNNQNPDVIVVGAGVGPSDWSPVANSPAAASRCG